MIKVVKGNVVLRVDDSLMDFYVDKGYTAKSLDGEILKEAVPTDVNSLRKAYLKCKSEIKALEAKVSALEAELASAKSQSAKSQSKPTAQPAVQEGDSPAVQEGDSIVLEEKPKRTRRKLSEEE